MRVRAKLYDGITSKEHIVELEFTPSHLIIEEFDIYVPLKDIKILSRLGNTPRVIELPDNIRCKVEDNDSLDRILEEIDYSLSPIHKFERSWKLAFGSIILIAAFIIFMLTAGADYSAALLAKMLPKDSLDYISKETLVELDKKYLHKSNLSLDKQQQIKELFS
ncbi:MAG: hypothetical protein GXN91_05835, partial [Epsilonproteobacteria bacterium]|nr:hypothetical protein [Campylobacterota bacterium]